MKMFKMISLCLCFSVFIFATDSNSKVKSIMVNKMIAKKGIAESQNTRGICDESATVTGFSDYNGNNTVDLCYEDGTGFFDFAWDGGCTLLSIGYSAGDSDTSEAGFTDGLIFFGFEPGATEDFVLTFDDGTVATLTGAVSYCGSDCASAGYAATCFDGGCADSEEACPTEGDCSDVVDPQYGETIIDCADNDCVPVAWIGDGFCDGTAQQYGADLCCYDADGGDCAPEVNGGVDGCAPLADPFCGDGICNGDETEASCPEDCASSADCEACDLDFTAYGSECCDTAWIEFGIDCATLEANYSWDCSGCSCPGDGPSCEEQGLITCCDGSCASDESDCAECDCTSVGGNETWIGDGYCDSINNNEFCGYDAGDCCPGDCVDSATYACSEFGGTCATCLDCGSADNATGGQCAGDGIGEGDDCEDTADPCADYDVAGDINNDDAVNVLDIVSVVNYILGDTLEECQMQAADMNGDVEINVLDIVSIVNVILGGRSADATSATMNIANDTVSISGNGFIGAIQMTLSHGAGFSIDLTDDAMVADYRTNGDMTTLVVVAPNSDEIFTANGDFTVEEAIVASGNGYVPLSMPNTFTLSAAYPNPFNPSTSLDMTMPSEGYVSIQAYNLVGQVVGTIAEGNMSAGTHSFVWDASDLSSGVYLIKAQYAGSVETQKVMLLK